MKADKTALVWIAVGMALFGAAGEGGEPLAVTVRRRVQEADQSGRFKVAIEDARWDPRKTAVIICDMWNQHWCKGATRRVAEMAPRMNEVVSAARKAGVLIVHAPSGTIKHYEGQPGRTRAKQAPRAADLPKEIGRWCNGIPAEKQGTWPIDQSDGGCDCEPRCKGGHPWTRQIDTIEIRPADAISDSGVEVWNLFAQRGVENVILMGVHTNMCVIGRPFGLRNMARFGKNVVLMRDLTDTMYNSRKAPYVNHFTGTDLIVEHIEKYVCPTVTSTIFTGTEPFQFTNDTRPRVVCISAESEYGAATSLPELGRFLAINGGVHTETLQGSTARRGAQRNAIPGIEALNRADLAVLFARRRALPPDQMRCLRTYLERGKPLIALRTSSHAFAVRGELPEGLVQWQAFDREVLGCRYHGYPHGETRVRVVPEARGHPILEGLRGPYQVRETMYLSTPLAASCTVLLMGHCVHGEGDDPRYHKKPGDDVPDQPLAWINTYKGAKVFYTSLGSGRASFTKPWFRRMLVNAVFWALEKPVPEKAKIKGGS